MENYNEKRKHPRLNLVWNIYRHNDNTLQHLGHIRNFSETGVLFASKLDLKKDDCFLINITVPEKLYPYIGVINLELDSQIVRVRDIKESAYHFEYGVIFQQPSAEDMRKINTFLKYWKGKDI
jgi:hypothetical protein